jgi:hypothetical protein
MNPLCYSVISCFLAFYCTNQADSIGFVHICSSRVSHGKSMTIVLAHSDKCL